MAGDTPKPSGPPALAEPLRNLGLVLIGLAALGAYRLWPRPEPTMVAAPAPIPIAPPPIPAEPVAPAPAAPLKVTMPLDQAAVARAEGELDAASRDRARAEAREAEAAAELRAASLRAASTALSRKALPATMRDPTARINRASARGTALRMETDRLKAEGAALAKVPKPKGKPLIDKSPVAKTAEGDEFHFEVRRDRVAFFDLEKLMEKVRTDARVRLRIAGPGARRIGGTVGPVGSFSMQYEMARDGVVVDELLDVRGMTTFNLTGWELVPEGNLRGETYETALTPSSEFSKALNRIRPGKTTVTMWVYPDGFDLYRKLRDYLNSRGFLVAARPLPQGIPIRGSPGGSTSAGQ